MKLDPMGSSFYQSGECPTCTVEQRISKCLACPAQACLLRGYPRHKARIPWLPWTGPPPSFGVHDQSTGSGAEMVAVGAGIQGYLAISGRSPMTGDLREDIRGIPR